MGVEEKGRAQHPQGPVSCTFSFSAQLPSRAAPRWLSSQTLRRPWLQDRRTTCGWPTPPVSWVLRWAQSRPPDAASTLRAPRRSPRPAHPPTQMSHPRLRTDPRRSGRSLAHGSRYFSQTPRPPSPSARTPELQGRKVPAVLERCHPAVGPCHALPNLSATSRLPDISGPSSPQQQFGASRAPRGGLQPRRRLALRLGYNPRSWPPSLHSPALPPSALAAASLPESPAPLQAAQRRLRPSTRTSRQVPTPRQQPQRRPGSALSRTLTLRPPAGSRGRCAAWLQPGLRWGT